MHDSVLDAHAIAAVADRIPMLISRADYRRSRLLAGGRGWHITCVPECAAATALGISFLNRRLGDG
jgi:hypothetical protein